MPALIGITGASASGKSTIANALVTAYQNADVTAVHYPLDNYYLPQNHVPPLQREKLNFDDPALLDWNRMIQDLKAIKNGRAVSIREYNFEQHIPGDKLIHIAPAQVVIVDGFLLAHDATVRAMMASLIFVHCPMDELMKRRVYRDVTERGRTEAQALTQWHDHVKPMFEEFGWPTRKYAEINLDGTQPTAKNVTIIADAIRSIVMNERGRDVSIQP